MMRREHLPTEQLEVWSRLNDVHYSNATVLSNVKAGDGTDKGAGIVATRPVSKDDTEDRILLSVPSELILSKERVNQISRTDKFLREVLDAAGDFAQKPRVAILIFLLLQITYSSPDLFGASIGVANQFTDYVKFLPKEFSLPTFYTDDERQLLLGTSLKDATEQKLASLEGEFETLRQLTESIAWCQKHWWDKETGYLTFQDWKLVDAMYRSRALELPGIGDAMAPLVDMANHASGDKYNARFEVDAERNILLILRDGKGIGLGEEINIQYGAGGACEMIFSYGFLELDATNAREMFLTFDIGPDDPLRFAKKTIAREAPGIRLFVNESGENCWESKYIWWACANEEDGLDFQIVQKVDGEKELEALWKGKELDPLDLETVLLSDRMQAIYKLRAVVTVQQRLEEQGSKLEESEQLSNYDGSRTQMVRPAILQIISKLKSLETELLNGVFDALEHEKGGLLASSTVQEYLARDNLTQSTTRQMEDEDKFA